MTNTDSYLRGKKKFNSSVYLILKLRSFWYLPDKISSSLRVIEALCYWLRIYIKIHSSVTVSCVERCENQPKHFELSPLNGHILVFHQSLSCERMTSQCLPWPLWVNRTVLSELNLASYVLLNSYIIYSQILIARSKSSGEDSFCSSAITAIMDPMGRYQFTPFCVFLTMLFLT